MKFAVITFPYSMDTDAGTAEGPKALLQAGLADWLRKQGHAVAGPFHVQLTPDEEATYGAWNKIGLANAQLARWSRKQRRRMPFRCFWKVIVMPLSVPWQGYRCLPAYLPHASV